MIFRSIPWSSKFYSLSFCLSQSHIFMWNIFILFISRINWCRLMAIKLKKHRKIHDKVYLYMHYLCDVKFSFYRICRKSSNFRQKLLSCKENSNSIFSQKTSAFSNEFSWRLKQNKNELLNMKNVKNIYFCSRIKMWFS